MAKVLVIIPAYNEAENIERVVKSLENAGDWDYVIINDGSVDDTAKICRQKHYNLIDLPVNLGLMGAFQTGLRYAYENGYDYALQFDGDGQHQPEYIDGMVELATTENLDIVIGSRFVTEKKPFTPRMMGSRVIGALIWMTTGKKINDPTSGMRLFGRDVIKKMAYDSSFAPEPETVSYFLKCGHTVKEYQVTMKEREAGESYLNFANSVKYMSVRCFSILILQLLRKRGK
ncbi:MAG: glycosyltransferase family 2 protein [Lachnospiraceae bacterium]|nr:glycosyltransferase family 2 protein [Lachnospiraceae bacterium]